MQRCLKRIRISLIQEVIKNAEGIDPADTSIGGGGREAVSLVDTGRGGPDLRQV